ncbi:RE2, partial [Symbiodinium necroappetens]
MSLACLAAFAAKNRTINKGGVSPMQAVTGRSTTIPGSLMQQISTGQMRYQYNQAMETNEALQRADRIRHGAIEAFHWLDAHTALRKALTSRSRPPTLEGIREGAVVYVYDPPVSRRGQARRLQDHSSWSGPGVIVCVERDTPVPQRVWVRLRGRVKAFPLEKIRLATLDEVASAQFVNEALKEVETELQGGQMLVDAGDEPPKDAAPPRQGKPTGAGDSSSSSDTSDTDGGEAARPSADPQAEEQERRAKLLDDVPMAMRNWADRRKSEQAALDDPHAWDFAKKQKVFEKLAQSLEPPSVLEEAQIRDHLTSIYSKFKEVKKALKPKPGGRTRGGGKAGTRAEAGRHASGVMLVEDDVDVGRWLRPGEYEALLSDTLGHWTLWSAPSKSAGVAGLQEVSVRMQHEEEGALEEGVTEVKTGKARIEYRWKDLDDSWKAAFVPALKKAVGVYLEHNGIRGVPTGKVLDPKRVLSSRFVLTNKGEEELSAAELKARWIFGGHKDPDAGLYATSAPTASTLAHNLLNFVAVQLGWTVHYEDVSSAFLQGKDLPRAEKVFVRVPHGYPQEVLDYLVEGLGGGDLRDDVVELTKAGFGLPESPRLWYLEYKDTIEDIGLGELTLVPGLFRAFHADGSLRAMASIHVDDTRYAGDSTSAVLWDLLHQRLKFGKMRKATDGWQKFCGRWERQDGDGHGMQISMQEYIKTIPMVKGRPPVFDVNFTGVFNFGFRADFYVNFWGVFNVGFRTDFYVNFWGAFNVGFRADFYVNFWGAFN